MDARVAVDKIANQRGSGAMTTADDNGFVVVRHGWIAREKCSRVYILFLMSLPPAGLEPATYSLGNCRSVLVSYGGGIRMGDTLEHNGKVWRFKNL